MKSVFNYETDPAVVSGGRWFDLRIGRDTIGRVKLRPAMTGLNAEWRKAKAEMFRQIAAEVAERKVETGEDLPNEYQGEVLADAMFGTIVLDYELYGDDDELLDVSRETFVEITRRVPIVLDAMLVQAEAFANWKLEQEKEQGKD